MTKSLVISVTSHQNVSSLIASGSKRIGFERASIVNISVD